jgi:hypothetical protein
MFSWNKLLDEDTTSIACADQPEVEFPLELWLQIYRYLSPLQLIEFGLLSKKHWEFSQRKNPETIATWKAQFESTFTHQPPKNTKFYLRQHFYQLYKSQLSKMREPIRKIFIFTVTGDVRNLRKMLENTLIEPDDLVEYGISDHLGGPRTSLLDYIQQTATPEIAMLFFDKIILYYQKFARDVPFASNGVVDTDCQGYTFVHWLALFSMFMTEETIEKYYTNYLNYIGAGTAAFPLSNHRSKLGLTALHFGAIVGSVSFLKAFERRIMDRDFLPPDLNAALNLNGAPEQLSFVDLAIQHGQINILKYLKDNKRWGWLNSTSATKGQKQLNLAVAYGHTDIIHFLWPILKEGSDTTSHMACHALFTALKVAQLESIKTVTQLFGSKETADLLNARASDFKLSDPWNHKKIDDYVDILSFLKNIGVNLQKYINALDKERFCLTLLHHAARQGNMRAVVRLVDLGAIHVRESFGTSYDHAAHQGFFKMAGFLKNTIFSSPVYSPTDNHTGDTNGVKMWYRRHA